MSMADATQTATSYFRTLVEFFGKQLDPDYSYEPNFSPRSYFAQYGAKDYIRIVIIVGTYGLIVRPFIEKIMKKLRDAAANKGEGPQPIPVQMPAWEAKDAEEEESGLDWGAKIRRRVKEARAKADAEAEDKEMNDSELDKYLD